MGFHIKESFFVIEIFFGGHVGKRGSDKISHGSNMDGKSVKDVVAEGGGGDGDDDVIGASLPGITEEFVKNGGFERLVGGEDGDLLTSSTKDFVDVMGDNSFASGTSNSDKFHVFDGVAIVGTEEFGA